MRLLRHKNRTRKMSLCRRPSPRCRRRKSRSQHPRLLQESDVFPNESSRRLILSDRSVTNATMPRRSSKPRMPDPNVLAFSIVRPLPACDIASMALFGRRIRIDVSDADSLVEFPEERLPPGLPERTSQHGPRMQGGKARTALDCQPGVTCDPEARGSRTCRADRLRPNQHLPRHSTPLPSSWRSCSAVCVLAIDVSIS